MSRAYLLLALVFSAILNVGADALASTNCQTMHIVPSRRTLADRFTIAFERGVYAMPAVYLLGVRETFDTHLSHGYDVVVKTNLPNDLANVRKRFEAYYSRKNVTATYTVTAHPAPCTGNKSMSIYSY